MVSNTIIMDAGTYIEQVRTCLCMKTGSKYMNGAGRLKNEKNLGPGVAAAAHCITESVLASAAASGYQESKQPASSTWCELIM